MKKQFDFGETNPSKQQEIEMLHFIQRTLMTAWNKSYIEDIFSNEFIQWCENRIKGDMPLDVWNYIEMGFDKANMQAKIDSLTERLEQQMATNSAILEDNREKQFQIGKLERDVKNERQNVLNARKAEDAYFQKLNGALEELDKNRANFASLLQEKTNLEGKLKIITEWAKEIFNDN